MSFHRNQLSRRHDGAATQNQGEKIVQLYLATGPDDEGATVNDGPSVSPLKCTLSRDLGVFERSHQSLPKPPADSRKGQTITGVLAFDYGLSADNAIHPGASGGIIVDTKTHHILGVLNAIDGGNDEPIALAVPAQSLVAFVSKAQPCRAHSIFPSTMESPRYVTRPNSLPMRNFIAVQTFAWGSGDKWPAAVSAHEVRVLDGHQRFRAYPDGKIELQDVPFPPLNTVMVPGGEWSELPGMVGTGLRVKIHQAADVLVNERRMKVFQYWAGPEDGICRWKSSSTLVSSLSTRLSPLLATANSGQTKMPTSSTCPSITDFRQVEKLVGRRHLRPAAARE